MISIFFYASSYVIKFLNSIIFILYFHTLFAQIEFTRLNSPTSLDFRGISFCNSSLGFVCGDNGTILRTTDSGDNWKMLSTGTNQKLWDIKALSRNGVDYVFAVGDNNTIIKSTNGGDSWNRIAAPFANGSFVFGIQIIDSLKYIICGGDFATISGAVAKTIDGGKTWVKTSILTSKFVDKVMFYNDSIGYAVGTNNSFNDGSIHKTNDGGKTWVLMKTSNQIITNVWCVSKDTVIAVGLNGQIWRSIDAGKSWKNQYQGSNDEFYGISFYNQSNGIVTGTNGLILYTKNAGETWEKVASPFTNVVQSASIFLPNIYIAGFSGIIGKAFILPTNLDSQNSINIDFILFPNPSRDNLKIVAKNGNFEGWVSICDSSGSKLFSEKIFGSEILINTNNLFKGTYFLFFQSENNLISVKKFIKE